MTLLLNNVLSVGRTEAVHCSQTRFIRNEGKKNAIRRILIKNALCFEFTF
jgi:hypothetical protein